MPEQKQISLPNYIFYSLSAAWKLVQGNPKAMDYFDLSSDGFWKSFWAIGLIIPIFLFKVFRDSGVGVQQPFASSIVYLVTALPITAVVMYYFTRFMKIEKNYISMVIAYNWLSAISVNVILIVGLLFTILLPESQMTAVADIIIWFYFTVYVAWFMFRQSLQISSWLAIGVLIFESLFNGAYQILLMRFIDPEVFSLLINQMNNPPS